MSLPDVYDIYIEIINHLPLNDIINLYLTNNHYHNIIKNIPHLEKPILFTKEIIKIHPEYVILFIFEELFENNQYLLASKLIGYVDTYYDVKNQNYDSFEEQVFRYFMGNEFVDKDDVNDFITMSDYSNVKKYIYNMLVYDLKDSIKIFFGKLKILNNIDDIGIQKMIKLFWIDNQTKIKNSLRPTGFMNEPYEDYIYEAIDKKYKKLDDKYR